MERSVSNSNGIKATGGSQVEKGVLTIRNLRSRSPAGDYRYDAQKPSAETPGECPRQEEQEALGRRQSGKAGLRRSRQKLRKRLKLSTTRLG